MSSAFNYKLTIFASQGSDLLPLLPPLADLEKVFKLTYWPMWLQSHTSIIYDIGKGDY